VSLVIDTSQGQAEPLAGVAAALSAFPTMVPLDITVAGDKTETLPSLTTIDSTAALRVAQSLRVLPTHGGADNAAAPTLVLEAITPDAALLWIHGPQPVELGNLERLRQVIERSASRPRIYELTTANGQNQVARALSESTPVVSLDTSLGIEPALRRLFQVWAGAPLFTFERNLLPEGSEAPAADAQTSEHLVRLWARDNVERLAAARKLDEAVKLTASYKLVTSVSGAVVLESAERYADAKLSPPGPEQVPSVPEPTTVVIVTLVMLGLTAFTLLQKSRNSRVTV
jgi:hypothetical protein